MNSELYVTGLYDWDSHAGVARARRREYGEHTLICCLAPNSLGVTCTALNHSVIEMKTKQRSDEELRV